MSICVCVCVFRANEKVQFPQEGLIKYTFFFLKQNVGLLKHNARNLWTLVVSMVAPVVHFYNLTQNISCSPCFWPYHVNVFHQVDFGLTVPKEFSEQDKPSAREDV